MQKNWWQIAMNLMDVGGGGVLRDEWIRVVQVWTCPQGRTHSSLSILQCTLSHFPLLAPTLPPAGQRCPSIDASGEKDSTTDWLEIVYANTPQSPCSSREEAWASYSKLCPSSLGGSKHILDLQFFSLSHSHPLPVLPGIISHALTPSSLVFLWGNPNSTWANLPQSWRSIRIRTPPLKGPQKHSHPIIHFCKICHKRLFRFYFCNDFSKCVYNLTKPGSTPDYLIFRIYHSLVYYYLSSFTRM